MAHITITYAELALVAEGGRGHSEIAFACFDGPPRDDSERPILFELVGNSNIYRITMVGDQPLVQVRKATVVLKVEWVDLPLWEEEGP